MSDIRKIIILTFGRSLDIITSNKGHLIDKEKHTKSQTR